MAGHLFVFASTLGCLGAGLGRHMTEEQKGKRAIGLLVDQERLGSFS